jgi:hypothetical protein
MADNDGAEAMTIEETNKLRAKLGLAPLEMTTDKASDDGRILGSDGTRFHHKPAENITESKKSEKIRAKLEKRKKKRDIDSKLSKVKGLGESDGEDDIKSWVQRSRKIHKAKAKAEAKEAAIRAREAEMEEERKIIEEETRNKAYSGNALAGLTVKHDIDRFGEGRDVILTLADSKILEEEKGPELQIIGAERAELRLSSGFSDGNSAQLFLLATQLSSAFSVGHSAQLSKISQLSLAQQNFTLAQLEQIVFWPSKFKTHLSINFSIQLAQFSRLSQQLSSAQLFFQNLQLRKRPL